MLGERYIVVKGDNLWRIAARTLGDGRQWPRIWKYNNRPEVVHVTGAPISNPDLLKAGQVLLIPTLPKVPTVYRPEARVPQPAAPTTASIPEPISVVPTPAPQGSSSPGHADQARGTNKPLAFKYRHDFRLPPTDIGTAIIEVRATGDVLLMTKRSYPAVFATSRGELELQVTQQANHAFGQLIGDNRYIYDPVQNRMAFRSMLVSQSTTPNAPATAIGVEMSSESPLPKLRAEIRLPKLQGSIDVFNYVAIDVKLVVEITPKPRPINPGPPAVPVVAGERSVDPGSKPDWAWAIGAGLLATSALIVVGTLIEDFVTGGAGTVDDPVSFSAAASAAVEGMAMISGAAVMLPKAAVPASVQVRTSVNLHR